MRTSIRRYVLVQDVAALIRRLGVTQLSMGWIVRESVRDVAQRHPGDETRRKIAGDAHRPGELQQAAREASGWFAVL